jgi:hypothetical protein
MSNNPKQTARSRSLKQRFHMRRAKFWKILLLLLIASVVFPLTLLFAISPFTSLAMFVSEVFSNHKYSKIHDALTKFVGSLILAPAVISFGWWVLVNIREIRSRHVRLAAGYAQIPAEEALANVRSAGHPFGLFLRGFEWEAASTIYYGPNPEIGSREAEIYARYVEALLVEMLNEDVPLVALADPKDPEPMAGVYRFEGVPDNWEQFIGELLPDAFPIVMYLTSFTSGIRTELRLISPPLYSSKTVIVVGRSLAIKNSPDGEEVLKFLEGFSHIVFEQIDKDWSREQEMEFHSRLQETLQVLESCSLAKLDIVRKGGGNFTVNTPTRLQGVINFMKGPTLGASFILTIMLFIQWLIGDLKVNNSLSLIGRLFLTWLVFILGLSVAKGLTYILGFAQASGGHKHFPTFSRMLKWIKKILSHQSD